VPVPVLTAASELSPVVVAMVLLSPDATPPSPMTPFSPAVRLPLLAFCDSPLAACASPPV
jgi:hypothetical protein